MQLPDIDVAVYNALDPVERAQVDAAIADIVALRHANPLEFYGPAGPKHEAFHRSDKRIRFISGGNRAGKTTTVTGEVCIDMAPPELVPERLRAFKRHDCTKDGPYRVRAVVPDLKRTGRVLKDSLKDWLPKALLKGGSFDKSWKTADDMLQLECGCFVELLSCEMDIDKFGGSARDLIWYDEEPPQEYRTESAMRLASTGGREVFSMTPLKGLTWVFREVWKKRGSAYVDAWAIGMRDNRFLKPEDVDFVLSLITNEAERAQREFGHFAERGGQLLPNILERLIDPPSKRALQSMEEIVVGLDPGWRVAGVTCHAFDADNLMLTFAAAALRKHDVAQYVVAMKRILKRWGLTIDDTTVVIDPSARITNLVTGQNVESALVEHDVPVVHGQNAVEPGVQELQRRLREGSWWVNRQLAGFQDECVEYALEDREDGKFQPKKGNDHRIDSARYAAMYRPWLPGERKIVIPPGADVARPPEPREAPGSVMGSMV